MIGQIGRIGLLIFSALILVATGPGSSESPAGGTQFRRGVLDVQLEEPTSLTFGPDGRLYAASQTDIIAMELDPTTREVKSVERIARNLRGVLGLAFDKTAVPGAPLTLYASGRDRTGVVGYQGRVSTFTAPGWTRRDVITGLPNSWPQLNHMTNGLAFDDAGRLFIAQGSNTEGGISDGEPRYNPESPLSAAILVADVNRPDFDGSLVYDPPGEAAGHNVDLVSGDVAVYAAGLRNAYDLVIHSNGNIYATDNGPEGQDGAASCSGGVLVANGADELNLIEEGNYYGFPNHNRARFDERQCTYRPAEDGSGGDLTGPIAVLARNCSCDGIAEYVGPESTAVANGDLIIARFTLDDLLRVELSEDGRSVTNIATMANGFSNPLDVIVGPDGTIYVAEFGGAAISYLTPVDSGTAPNRPPGDADCSGETDSRDATLVLQAVAGLVQGLPCADAADTNSDGDINAVDASLILQIEAGLL